MANNSPSNLYVLGLDVGDARTGVAIASSIARLPRPLQPLQNDADVYKKITALVTKENISQVVVGLPRSLDGQETAQSQKVRAFADQLEKHLDCPVVFAEETLSTARAEAELKNRKNQAVSADSLAACYILEEFFSTQGVSA